MLLPETQLIIKRSQIPGAGKGLFTKCLIAKGTFIIECKGSIVTWAQVQQAKKFNGYVYYVNKDHVIDARPHKEYIARYANDAKGTTAVPGLKNNCCFQILDNKFYLLAIKKIQAGEEILVTYGRHYWNAIRHNNQLARKKEEI